NRWEWLKIAVLALLAAWTLSGCSPCERLSRRCPPIEYVRDSIHIHDTLIREVRITDTLMLVELVQETVRESVPIEDTAKAETDYARAEAYVDGSNIHLTLSNKDSAEVLVQRIETLERQLREAYREFENKKVQTVYKTRGIVKAGAWIGLASVILLLLRIAYLILKRR
ncbi:MAG: hypothetical protein NC324_08590, partial [Bacteroides sp.]|nr:hypothetical protein [Bacteroides sp.]